MTDAYSVGYEDGFVHQSPNRLKNFDPDYDYKAGYYDGLEDYYDGDWYWNNEEI